MHLLINATSVSTGRLTGIERFGLRIAQELCRIDPSTSIVGTQEFPGLPNVTRPQLLALGSRILARKEYLLRAVWDQVAFRHIAAKSRADVVFFPIQDGLLFPPVSQIVTIHDLHYHHFGSSIAECQDEIGAVRRSFFKWKMPHILNSSAAIVAVSEATRRDIASSFGVPSSKIHVIHNGYDEDRFRIIGQPDDVLSRYGLVRDGYIVLVGSILPHKNLVRLVQAFSRLNTSDKLVIAGACKDSAYKLEVVKAAQDAGLAADRLRFLEYVSDEDLPYLYNGARLFALPSLHEGFGVPIIEAMACGVPVITSNCSAMPEVAGDAAMLVDPYSVDSIYRGMREIQENPGLADRLKAAGHERTGLFKWSTSAQKLYELFQKVSET